MSERQFGAHELPLSRRDALKGLAGVGAASVLAQQSDRVTSLVQSSEEKQLLLPVENVREVWGHWDDAPEWDHDALYRLVPEFTSEGTIDPVAATRGLKQTNLLTIDDDRSWRNDCNGRPGIEHRFTAVGYYRNVSGANLTISVDDSVVEECGTVALTPNYFYYTDESTSPVPNADRHDHHGQMVTDLEDQIDRRLSEEAPRRMESMIAGAELITGVLQIAARTPHPAVQAAAVGLTIASLVYSLSEAERELEHDTEAGEIELSIDSSGVISTFFVDFSVVVPPNAEDVTVEVAHEVDDVSIQDAMAFDDLTYTVELPPVDAGQDPGDLDPDQIPTIETSGEPLVTGAEGDDGSFAARAEPPDDALETKAWQVDDGFTGDRATDGITTSALDSGVHSVRYFGHEDRYTSAYGVGYICERLEQVGDPYYLEVPPSAAIDGPREAGVEESVTFEGSAESPNGISGHRWEVVTDVQGREPATVDSQSGDGHPEEFETSLPGDNYRVRLTVTDDSSEDLTGTARQQLRVFDTVYDVSILAPDVTPTGQSVPIEFEIDGVEEEGLGYESIVWSGAVIEGGDRTLEHAFEETGERTVELFVLDTDNNPGSAEHTIDVVDESPVDVSVSGPTEAEPGETVTYEGAASSPNGEIGSYVWEVTNRPRNADGPVTVETQEGTGPSIGDFEPSLEGDVYDVHLRATDEAGVRGTASHDLDVHRSLDADIDAPDVVPTGQTVPFSIDVVGEDENDLHFQAVNWSGAFVDSGRETTQSFDSTGQRTAVVTVTTTENARGSAELDFEVTQSSPVNASVSGPSSAASGESVTYEGSASSPNGEIESYVWTVTNRPRGASGPVEVEREEGTGPSIHDFETSLEGDVYDVHVQATDEDGISGTASHDLDVTRQLNVQIEAPEAVPTGETVPFSIDVVGESDLHFQAVNWSGAFVDSGQRTTQSFDSTGQRTVEVSVTTTDNARGSAELDFEVTQSSPVDVSVSGPSSAASDESVTYGGSASSPNGDIESYVWEVTNRPRNAGGPVTVEREEGTGPSIHDFETALEGDIYDVNLHVTDENGVPGSASHDLDVHRSLDVEIDAPEAVPTGETVPFSIDVVGESDLHYQAVNWSGAFIDSGRETTQSFDSTGQRTVEVTVTTTENARGSAAYDFEVTQSSPVDVSVSGPSEAEPGESLAYEGSASSPNGGIESYVWEVTNRPRGAGGPVEVEREEGTGPSIDDFETSLSGDVYDVHLRATDEDGFRESTSHDLDVHRSLDVDIDAPSSITVGESASFSIDVVGESDPSFQAVNWSGAFIDSGQETTQSFDSTGQRTVEVTVTTTENARGSAEHTFDVEEETYEPPNAVIDGPTSGILDLELEFDGSGSSGSAAIESYDWTVDRESTGRGDPGTPNIASGSGPTFTFSPRFEATYVVQLTVEDARGETDEHEQEVTVSELGPVV